MPVRAGVARLIKVLSHSTAGGVNKSCALLQNRVELLCHMSYEVITQQSNEHAHD